MGYWRRRVAFTIVCNRCDATVCVTNRVDVPDEAKLRDHLASQHPPVPTPLTLGVLLSQFTVSGDRDPHPAA